MSSARSGFVPLRTFQSPGYRYLWTASVLWNQARWMDMVVLSWVVLELTSSAWDVAIIGVLRSLPILLFGVLGGAIADRFDRKLLLMTAQAGGALVSLAVALLLVAGVFRFEHAAVAALLLGLQWAIDWPARRALIPDLVGKDLIMNAIVLESVSMNLTRVIGPLAAGALIYYLGAASAYLAMAALYAIEIILLGAMPLARGGRAVASGSMIRYLRDGWRELRVSEPIVAVLLITVFMNMLAFPYQQILSVFARDVFQTDAVGLGILGAAAGVGSLTGALILSSRGRVPRPGLLYAVGSFLMSASLIGFALVGDFGLALAFLVVSGIASSAFAAFQSTIILGAASEQLRGRAMGALTLAIGTAPLGLVEIGALTTVLGAPRAVALNAALCALLVVAVAAAYPRLCRLD